MWELTITHGEYHDLKTVTHTSPTQHGWTYVGDGYWQFFAGPMAGGGEWDAIVSDVRAAVDVKQVEPATAQDVDDSDEPPDYHAEGTYCGESAHCTPPYEGALPGTPYEETTD